MAAPRHRMRSTWWWGRIEAGEVHESRLLGCYLIRVWLTMPAEIMATHAHNCYQGHCILAGPCSS